MDDSAESEFLESLAAEPIDRPAPKNLDQKPAPPRTRADVEEDFAEAIIHRAKGHRVLGFKLKPFSRWHAAQLDFVESPFAGHEKTLDLPELYLSARICQSQFPCRWHRTHLQRWHELACAWRYRAFLKELNKFAIYLRDYSGGPEYILGEDARPIKTPWYLFQVASLVTHGLSLRDAWNIPIGEGNWLLCALAETNGIKIDILTPQDRRDLKELAEMRRAREAR